jgi:hypothetical protein
VVRVSVCVRWCMYCVQLGRGVQVSPVSEYSSAGQDAHSDDWSCRVWWWSPHREHSVDPNRCAAVPRGQGWHHVSA